IINEFGDIGIDGEILKGCGEALCREKDVIELSNGCICCTVADDFVPTMQKLLDRADPPEHIVIETSGLALPQPLVRAFNWPEIRGRVTVDSVVTVVDAKAMAEGRFADDEEAVARQRAADANLDHENPIEELFEDQLACADMVIVNKTDLLSEADLGRIAGDLGSQVRRGTRLVPTRHGAIDVAALLGVGAAAEDDMENRLSHHEVEGETQHDHDDFVTFVVDLGAGQSRERLLARIAETLAAHDILRLKGFADIEGSGARLLVQAVGPRLNDYFDRPWKMAEARATRLVVIGSRAMDRAAIARSLAD
ncbi:MAG: cobalamin biosynthesis protein CobW, partial [Rhizobiales bacterium]|nr:cobalamin biosynthesis protein CobW [Hyphomicrobiales bacterium]